MKKNTKKILISILVALFVTNTVAAQTATPTPVTGTTAVSQRINIGAFTVQPPSAVSLPDITASTSNQTVTGTASTWRVEDARGKKPSQQPGWSLNVSSTNFVDTDIANPSTIAITNLTITPQSLVAESGSLTGVTLGTAGAFTGVGVARNVVIASTLNGKGRYKGDLGLSLVVPGNSDAVSYTATLTFSLQ